MKDRIIFGLTEKQVILKFLIFLFFIFSCFCGFGQTLADVKTSNGSVLIKKWMGANVACVTFRNGDSIKIARSLNEWKSLSGGGKINEPVVYIRKTNTGDEYYYNWYAISDPRNIAPVGYRLPETADFKCNIDLDRSNLGRLFTNSTTLYLAPYGSIEWDGVNMNFYFSKSEDNSLYIWTGTSGSDLEYAVVENISKSDTGIEARASQSFKTCGYIVRCIEDKTSEAVVLDYGIAFPDKLDLIMKNIGEFTKRLLKTSPNEKFRAEIEVSCNEQGSNTSRLVQYLGSYSGDNFKDSLVRILKDISPVSRLNGIAVAAKKNIVVELAIISGQQLSIFFLDEDGKMLKEFKVNERKKEMSITKNNPGDIIVSNVNPSQTTGVSHERKSKKNLELNRIRLAKEKEERKNTRNIEKINKHNLHAEERYRREQNRLKANTERKSNRFAEYSINGHTVIKNYVGLAMGTVHPILKMAQANQFSGTTHSGFASMGFLASLDSYIRIKNGIGFKIKLDVMDFNFNTRKYESISMGPTYQIVNKTDNWISKNYYLMQNLMAGFSVNLGTNKFLLEISALAGITTGLNPSFNYTLASGGGQFSSRQNFFWGWGYQVASAFRIRCSPTFAIKIGANYIDSRISNYFNPGPDSHGAFNIGGLRVTCLSPQIAFVGTLFKFK